MLGGGGAKGAAEVGVLKVLEEAPVQAGLIPLCNEAGHPLQTGVGNPPGKHEYAVLRFQSVF